MPAVVHAVHQRYDFWAIILGRPAGELKTSGQAARQVLRNYLCAARCVELLTQRTGEAHKTRDLGRPTLERDHTWVPNCQPVLGTF